ncbi:hypothetical protein RIR_jg39712.t1 [Rhizophagus irregularis DAOM 181602=DAOM 197198]|nr:hypothetical protein RIR_jg39712.t1 [Rhizophagus irregularis DAOM 181602=DAOM 197198]
MDFRCFDFRKRGNEMMVFRHASLGFEMVFRRIIRNEPVPDVRMMVPDVWIMEIKTNWNAGRNYDPDFGEREKRKLKGKGTFRRFSPASNLALDI